MDLGSLPYHDLDPPLTEGRHALAGPIILNKGLLLSLEASQTLSFVESQTPFFLLPSVCVCYLSMIR